MMLVDLADPMARHTNDTTQTDFPIPIAKETQLQTTTIHVDSNPTPTPANQQQQQHQQVIQVHQQPDAANINTLPGHYVRGDEVDFVQTQQVPSQQQPVFEKILWPEKQRPHKFTVPQPNRAHVQHQARNNFNNVPVREDVVYGRNNNYPHAGYSQQSTYNLSKSMPPNYCHQQPSQRHQEVGEDRPMAAIRPGFVANAARLWDSRARRTNDLNTIV